MSDNVPKPPSYPSGDYGLISIRDGIEQATTIDISTKALMDEITRLRADLEKAKEALMPFADVAEWDISHNEADADSYKPMNPRYAVGGAITVGHLRRAAATLKEIDK